MNRLFCRQCGQSLDPGSRFCAVCGTPVSPTPIMPNAPQTGISGAAAPFPPVIPQPNGRLAARTGRSRKINGASIVLILIGVLFVLMALRLPLLGVAGKTTAGTVTRVRQVINSNSSRMDRNYDITYEFRTDGKLRAGSFSMNRVFNANHLPAEGSTIQIRYLPGFSFVSQPTQETEKPLSVLLFIALGALLIFFGATGRARFSRRTR